MDSVYLVPAIGSLAACLSGMAVRAGLWREFWALALLFAATLVVGGLVASARDPGVSTRDFTTGLVVGTLGLGALPLAAYYSLGRFVGNRVALAVVWAVSLPVLAIYLIFVGLYTTGLVACPPDANECPF